VARDQASSDPLRRSGHHDKSVCVVHATDVAPALQVRKGTAEYKHSSRTWKNPDGSRRKGYLRGVGHPDDRVADEPAGRVGVERGRPEEIDRAWLVRERDRRETQVRANAEDLRCHDARNGCDEATSIHEGADASEAGDRAPHAALLAEGILDDAAEVSVVRDDDVLLRQVCALGRTRAEAHETRIEDADEVTAQEPATRDRGGKVIGNRDGDVDATGGECFVHGAKLDRAAHEADARSFDVEETEKAREEPLVGDVGEPDSKCAIGGPGIEPRGLECCLQEGVEVRAGFGDEARASLGEHHAAPMADHDRFSDGRFQATECRADRRLREIEALGGRGHGAGIGHGDEHGEQVEIEVPRMNDVHELYLSYSLVHSSANVTLASMSNMHSMVLGGSFTFPGTSLRVNRLGYGAMQLAGPGVFGPPRDVDGAIALLREAVASGVNHIDTSDFYGPHVTNEIIRKALHPYPADLVLVTKIGFLRRADKSWYPAASAAELTSAVHDNLKNLGLDALDIVNLRCGAAHAPNDESIAERLAVLVDLKRQGLVRHIGLSTIDLAQYKEARKMAEIVCVQNEYNVAQRADDAMIAELAKEGVAYVPYFPLGGFTPLQSSALAEIAAAAESTPMQVALAWLLQRSPNILLIPGTSSLGHLRENLAAAKLQLSPKMIETLDSIAAQAQPHSAAH